MRFLLKGCFLWVCFVLMAGTAHSQTLDRIVATVNGDIILYSELQEFIKTTVAANPSLKTDDEASQRQLEQEALRQLVRSRLAEQEAKRLKIVVSDQDVDEALKGIQKDNGVTEAQFQKMLEEQGKTLKQFRDVVRKEMVRGRLLDRVLKSKTVITDQQVDAAIAGSYGFSNEDGGKRMQLGLIYLPFEKSGQSSQEAEKQAQELLTKLRKGADFAEAARKYSKGPAAEEGGNIGFISKGELADYIDSAVQGLKKNEISDLVKTDRGFYIIKVLDIDSGVKKDGKKTVAVDAERREQVRQELYRAELDRKFDEWVRELEERSFIKIFL